MDTSIYEDKIISLEERINKLFLLSDEIRQNNGMSKKVALECQAIIPNFNNSIPLAYYTKKPSIAEFHISLEELSKGIWALIIAAIAAAMVTIYKFFNWLFGNNDSGGSSSSSVPDKKSLTTIQDNTETIDVELKKLNEATINHVSTGVIGTEDFSHYKVRDINDIVGRYIESKGSESELAKVLNEEDPIFHDVLNHGEYTKAIKSTSGVISNLPKDITTSVEMYVNAIKEVETSLHKIQNDGHMTELAFNHDRVKVIIGNGNATIDSLVTGITTIKSKVLSSKLSTNKISFTKLSELFLHSLKNVDIVGIIIKLESTESHLKGLLTKLTKANEDVERVAKTHDDTDPISTKYAKNLNQTFTIVKTDVMDCFKFFKEVMVYATTIMNMDIKIRNVQRAALNIIEVELKRYGELPKEIQEIYKHLDKQVVFR